MSKLSDVSILLRTFLRDDKLFNSIAAIKRNMSELHMIIVDDGEMTEEKDGIYADLIREGHTIILLPFDSGFGAKSNAGIQALVRPYILISSDDFNHNSGSVKVGIEKMLAVLDRNPELGVVSGRVNDRAYEFLFVDEGHTITEWVARPFIAQFYQGWYPVDLTVNYSLIRKRVFEKVKWDDDVKIGGGEHGAFFLDLKRANFKVGFVPGVNIDQQLGRDSERYQSFRNRARGPERLCFERRGIRKYVLGNGQVDYERKD